MSLKYSAVVALLGASFVTPVMAKSLGTRISLRSDAYPGMMYPIELTENSLLHLRTRTGIGAGYRKYIHNTVYGVHFSLVPKICGVKAQVCIKNKTTISEVTAEALAISTTVNSGFEILHSKWSVEGGFYHGLTNLYASSVKTTIAPTSLVKLFIEQHKDWVDNRGLWIGGVERQLDRSTKCRFSLNNNLIPYFSLEWTPADCLPGHQKLLYKPVFPSLQHNTFESLSRDMVHLSHF
jgi:hypothetical protein